eukprot:jgi/Mesen1/9372/ME000610S08690
MMEDRLAGYVQEFHEKAQSPSVSRAGEELLALIADIKYTCQELVGDDQLDFISSAVFDCDNGILSALESCVLVKEKDVQKAVEQSLQLLTDITVKVGERVEPYTGLIREKCFAIFRVSESNAVKAAALEPLLALLGMHAALFPAADVAAAHDAVKVLKACFHKAKNAATLRARILELLGDLVEFFPASFRSSSQAAQVHELVQLALDALDGSGSRDPPAVLQAGVMKSLDSLLTFFDDSHPAGGTNESSKRIYLYLKASIEFPATYTRYDPLRASLGLLGRHARLFRLQLLLDGPATFTWLQSWCTHVNAEVRDAALAALDSFLVQMAMALTEDDPRVSERDRASCYKALMADVLTALESSSSGGKGGEDARRVALALRALGRLAAPTLKYHGQPELVRSLQRLLPFAASSLRGQVAKEEDTLGHCVTVSERRGGVCGAYLGGPPVRCQVAEHILVLFPELWPKQKGAVYRALRSLLHALFSKGPAFSLFVDTAVRSSLERAIAPAEVLPGGAADDVPEALWPHYEELWRNTLQYDPGGDGAGSRGVGNAGGGGGAQEGGEAGGSPMDVDSDGERDGGRCSSRAEEGHGTTTKTTAAEEKKKMEMAEVVFDAVVGAVLGRLKGLNVRYHHPSSRLQQQQQQQEEEEEAPPPSNLGAAHPPPPPPLPAVQCCAPQLIHAGRPGGRWGQKGMFVKWVFPWARDVVALSCRYALLSGFYKLLAAAIALADDRAYFSTTPAPPAVGGGPRQLALHQVAGANSGTTALEEEEEEERRLCGGLLRKYLREVLERSRRYKQELLTACLRLCLAAPTSLLDVGARVGPTRHALQLGLRYPPPPHSLSLARPSPFSWSLAPFAILLWRSLALLGDARACTYVPLAEVAMHALEGWQLHHPQHLLPHLPALVPCLGGYLADVNALREEEQAAPPAGDSATSTRTASRRQLDRMRSERELAAQGNLHIHMGVGSCVSEQAGPLEVVQLRVQRFLGKLGGHAHLLVPDGELRGPDGNSSAADKWDSAQRVKLTLPFRDEKPAIWLDALLPRLVELAHAAPLRQTKVAACEALHAVSVFLVGCSAKGPARTPGLDSHFVDYEKVYRKLFPAILRLATDVDLVSRQLYEELSAQVVHWFTSNTQRDNPATLALLDALLDGLASDCSASLRELCAQRLADFLAWSLKHSPADPHKGVKCANMASVLRRLHGRLDHPCALQRLGAAMAAARICPVLRASSSEAATHVLALLFFCMKGLRLVDRDLEHDSHIGTEMQLSGAIEVLSRLMVRVRHDLREARRDRPVFESLQAWAEWAFQQTGALEPRYRARAMALFATTCRCLPEGSPGSWLQKRRSSSSNTLQPFQLQQAAPHAVSAAAAAAAAAAPAAAQHAHAHAQVLAYLKQVARDAHWHQWALDCSLPLQQPPHTLDDSAGQQQQLRLELMDFLRVVAGGRLAEAAAKWALTPAEQMVLVAATCSAILAVLHLCKLLARSGTPSPRMRAVGEFSAAKSHSGMAAPVPPALQAWEAAVLQPLTEDACFLHLLSACVLRPHKLLGLELGPGLGLGVLPGAGTDANTDSDSKRDAGLQGLGEAAMQVMHARAESSPAFRDAIVRHLADKLATGGPVYNVAAALAGAALGGEATFAAAAPIPAAARHVSSQEVASLVRGYQLLHTAGVLVPMLGSKERAQEMAGQLAQRVFALPSSCPPSVLQLGAAVLALATSLGLPVPRLLHLALSDSGEGEGGGGTGGRDARGRKRKLEEATPAGGGGERGALGFTSQKNLEENEGGGDERQEEEEGEEGGARVLLLLQQYSPVILRHCKFECAQAVPLLMRATSARQRTAKLLLFALLDDCCVAGGAGKLLTHSVVLQQCLGHLQELEGWCAQSSRLSDKLAFLQLLQKLFLLDFARNTVLTPGPAGEDGHGPQQHHSRFIIDYYVAFLEGQHAPPHSTGLAKGGGGAGGTGEEERAALQRDALLLLPSFLSACHLDKDGTANGGDTCARLLRAAGGVVTQHLLVRDADLEAGGVVQRGAYLAMLESVLGAVMRSGCLGLLEAAVFPLLLQPTKAGSRALALALRAFVSSNAHAPQDALDLCMRVLLDANQRPRLKREVVRQLAVPLCRAATLPNSVLVEWFAAHLPALVAILSTRSRQDGGDSEEVEEGVTRRTCAYQLLACLYDQAGEAGIRERISATLPNKDILKWAREDSRALHSPHPPPHGQAGWWREMQCAAYNALAAVLMRTQDPVAKAKLFARYLLSEDQRGDMPLWQHLVDCSKTHDSLPVETRLQSSQLAVRDMRASNKEASSSSAAGAGVVGGTLSSQYLAMGAPFGSFLGPPPAAAAAATATAVGGVGGGTFLGGNTLSASLPVGGSLGVDSTFAAGMGAAAASEDGDAGGGAGAEGGPGGVGVGKGGDKEGGRDDDDWDRHLCMPTLLRLLRFLHAHPAPPSGGGSSSSSGSSKKGMPEWMEALRRSLAAKESPINVRLFLVKVLSLALAPRTSMASGWQVVTRAQEVFAAHAGAWLEPYVRALLDNPAGSGGMRFHYLLRDVCVTVLQWRAPLPPHARGVCSQLVNHLMRVAWHQSRPVLSANIAIVRLFLDMWRDAVALDRNIVVGLLKAKEETGKEKDDEKARMAKRGTGLQLLGAMAVSGLPVCDPAGDDVTEEALYACLLLCLKERARGIRDAAAEVIGMALHQRLAAARARHPPPPPSMDNDGAGTAAAEADATVERAVLEEPLRRALVEMYRRSEYDAFLFALNKLTLRFPALLARERLSGLVADLLPHVHGTLKAVALDVLLRGGAGLVPDLFRTIAPDLPRLVRQRDEQAQLKVLQLLGSLVGGMSDGEVAARLLPLLCSAFGAHPNAECRREFYKLVASLYETRYERAHELRLRIMRACRVAPLVSQVLVIVQEKNKCVPWGVANFWLVYSVAMAVWCRSELRGNAELRLHALRGLDDVSPAIRKRAVGLWHAQLPREPGARVVALLADAHTPQTEDSWPQNAALLLLKLCEDSVDYRRPLFDAPLAQCVFVERSINTAAMSAAASLPTTPLFSLTHSQAHSQHHSQPMRSQGGPGSVAEDDGGAPGAGMVRATLTPSLTLPLSQSQPQSQWHQHDGGDAYGSQQTQSFGELLGSSLLAASPSLGAAGTDSQVLGLQQPQQQGGGTPGERGAEANLPWRRIAMGGGAGVVRNVLNARRRREAQAVQQAAQRAGAVSVMRSYRSGDYPDIEIECRALLGPLAEVGRQDARFGALLLTAVVCAVAFSSPDARPAIGRAGDRGGAGEAGGAGGINGEGKRENVRASLRVALQGAFKKTRGDSSQFVGSLVDVALQDCSPALLHLDPKLVASTCTRAASLHSGALLLEAQLLQAHHPAAAAAAASAAAVDDATLVVFERHVVRLPLTREALAAEMGGDPLRALVLYDAALDALDTAEGESPRTRRSLKVEEDVAYDQRLGCMEALTKWQELSEDVAEQLEVPTSPSASSSSVDYLRLWGPAEQAPQGVDLQGVYLPRFIRSAVKCPRMHAHLAAFLQHSCAPASSSQQLAEERKEALERDFGWELASLSAATGHVERARLQVAQCYRSVRRQWSMLSPLATGSRHALIGLLEKTVELDEWLTLDQRQQQGMSVRQLAGRVCARWPSWQADNVQVWDDIVHTREQQLEKHRVQLLRVRGSPAGGAGSGAEAAELYGERAQLWLRAAAGARKMGNLDVAQAARKQPYDPTTAAGLLLSALALIDKCDPPEGTSSSSSRTRSPTFDLLRADTSAQLALSTATWHPPGTRLLNQPEMNHLATAYASYTRAVATASAAADGGGGAGDGSDDGSSGGGSKARVASKAALKLALFCDDLLTAPASLGPSQEEEEGGKQQGAGLPPASSYAALVVDNLLKALAGSSAGGASMPARCGLARVLALLGKHPHTLSCFRARAPRVPTWLFIAWIPQMLAAVDEPEGEALVRILEAIAAQYPQALFFPYRVSREDMSALAKERTARLAGLLESPRLESFARALEDVAWFPQQRLEAGLEDIAVCLQRGDRRQAAAVYRRVFADCLDEAAMRAPGRQAGEYNLKFAQGYRAHVEKELGAGGSRLASGEIEPRSFRAWYLKLREKLRAGAGTPSGQLSLAAHSAWLASYDPLAAAGAAGVAAAAGLGAGAGAAKKAEGKMEMEVEVEIPGQYASWDAPDPEAHVKLVGVDAQMRAFASKQSPKLVTMRGSDEREYRFVLKGGEDVRQDQRVQQLFQVMNQVLLQDAACAKRRLRVRTYGVVPLSKRCGLLQYVAHSRVLHDVLCDGLAAVWAAARHTSAAAASITTTTATRSSTSSGGDKKPEEFFAELAADYGKWVTRRGSQGQDARGGRAAMYQRMYEIVGRDEVARQLASLQRQVPWDTLRTGVAKMAAGPEDFFNMRAQLAHSMAALSVCGYVAGVGDRHLRNFVVDTRDGTLVGIDFGYSFGTATQLLEVPELVPFRLTAQLTALVLPLDGAALLRADMVHCLAALRRKRAVLTAVLDVFVREPLYAWKMEALRAQARHARSKVEDGADMLGESAEGQEASGEQKHVEFKVETAHRKLELWNPAHVTAADLAQSIHAHKPACLKALEGLARGDIIHNVRARTGPICASVQEQVDCLIDQATDPNLLGRIWEGWMPWV